MMINFPSPKRRLRGLILFLALMMSPLGISVVQGAESATRYKKQTVVDFEGALVEGKSRKPYSAYLTQQKEAAFGELHSWQPDLNKSLLDAQRKVDKSL